ncbi:MAG: right-handed parallel beta-helix repeat-containing protein [Thermoanaerobaculia bacterium]
MRGLQRFAVPALLLGALAAPAAATTFYVSSASGDDLDDGLTPATAFASIAKVNSLALVAGDVVRFFCGETWRTDPLVLTRSGAAGNPIVVSSHPAGCADKPLLSGAWPIRGWAADAPNVVRAALGAGANAGHFPNGVDQLFRGANRLPFGRWPNREDHADGGWATIDAQPNATQFTDAELPAGDWTGAVAHVKGIRWYVMNRNVTADGGSTLTVNDALSCWGGCTGWGYFLSSHRATLDREGEWFWDAATNTVYLYTAQGVPADDAIEASVVMPTSSSFAGGVVLGTHLAQEIAWVTLENLRVERWWDNGVTTPTNLEADENHDLVLQDLEVRDVDDAGIRLTTWVWNAAAHGNGPNGWRGGRNQTVRRNLVERANSFGIDSFARQTLFEDNVLRDVASIEYLGREGMGCGFTGTNCTEHGDGIRVNRGGETPDHSGLGNTLRRNRLERVGMNGIDVFARQNLIENNVVSVACRTKGDCGAIRTFGDGTLATTHVADVTIRGNLFLDTYGNTDGCRSDFDTLFGFGVYVDHFSKNVTVEDNTVAGSTWVGVLFQDSTGSASGNTLFDDAIPGSFGAELDVVGAVADVDSFDNRFVTFTAQERTIRVDSPSALGTSDANVYFSPYLDASLDSGAGTMNLAGWKSSTGLDPTSIAHWFVESSGAPPRATLFVNDLDVPIDVELGATAWFDLAHAPVSGSFSLPAFSSRVLVHDWLFADGFEAGTTARWSAAAP